MFKFKEKAVLMRGSEHTYMCRCVTCLAWWALMGPEDRDDPSFGPFTEAEVEAFKMHGTFPGGDEIEKVLRDFNEDFNE